MVRKGEVAARLATGPSVAASVHGPIGTGFSPTAGIQLGWAFELPVISLVPRLSLGRSTPNTLDNEVLDHTLTEVTAELAGMYVFDVGPVSLAPVLSVGAAFYDQRVEFSPNSRSCVEGTCNVASRPLGLVTSVGGWFGWPLGYGFSLEATA